MKEPRGFPGFSAFSRFSGFTTAIVSLVAAAQASAQVPSYSKDVAPVFFARCAKCHHPGGAGPFSVLTYADVKPKATLIAAATKSRYMPPWKAEPVPGGFVGQTRLNDEEIDLIQRWVEGGAIEGNPRDLPQAPRIAPGWQLGKPDLVVAPAAAFSLPPGGVDVFRIFVIPLPVDRLRYVRGLEFRPGNPRVVHHANIRVDRTRASRRLDEADPEPGYDGLIPHSAMYPDGHFLGWTPGQVAPLLPKGLAWRLDRDSDLVVEVHMQPDGRTETVQPSIGLYFTDDAPERTPLMLRLGRQSIDIPPGTAGYTTTDSFVLPVDVEIEAVQPHAHYRAREVHGTATLPDGTVKHLIDITDWDFRWQHVYRYVQPLKLPRGTTLAMRFTFDNSAANPRNPQQPPVRVRWGQRSRDEMGDLWIQALPDNEHDLATLERAFRPKVMAEDTIGYEREIDRDETDIGLHDDVAQLYLNLGRPEEAVKHFGASARLNPSSASTHFNLGTALIVAGRADEARAEFDRALAIRPDYAQAHNNLGSLFLQLGRAPDALGHFREAVRIEPANVEAQSNLATALAATGDFKSAVDALQRAARLSPAEPLATSIRERLTLYRQNRVK
jgi:Flp pilus assembly protein TadD/mono/diheme cytochrome c family protein